MKRLIGLAVVVGLLGGWASTTTVAQDTTTLLSKFLVDLRNGSLGFPLGTGGTSGRITASADGVFTLLNAAGTSFSRLNFGGTTTSFPALKRSTNRIQVRLADDSDWGFFDVASMTTNAGGIQLAGSLDSFFIGSSKLIINSAPSSPSSCGTSPAVTTATVGTAAFVITGGTGGTATGCTITMPAATTGWNCNITNITQTAAHRADRGTVQTASTTTSVTWEYVTLSSGAATAFTASDVFRGICFAF